MQLFMLHVYGFTQACSVFLFISAFYCWLFKGIACSTLGTDITPAPYALLVGPYVNFNRKLDGIRIINDSLCGEQLKIKLHSKD